MQPAAAHCAASSGPRCLCSDSSRAPIGNPLLRSHSLLFLSPVWPEPSSSAAGVRTSELISGFQGCGAEVTYVSTSADSPENEHTSRLRQASVQVHQCPANREQQLQAVIEACQPSVCIFDR